MRLKELDPFIECRCFGCPLSSLVLVQSRIPLNYRDSEFTSDWTSFMFALFARILRAANPSRLLVADNEWTTLNSEYHACDMLLSNYGASKAPTLGKTHRRAVVAMMASFEGTSSLAADAMRSSLAFVRGRGAAL